MKKSAYVKGRMGGFVLNFAEHLISVVVFRKRPKDITLEKRIRYGDGPKEYSNLIYKKSESKKPLLIYIHGGGFCSGLVNMRNGYCYEFAKRNWFVANVGYEYAPQKTFPYQFAQLFKAIDWLYDNSDKYKIDMDNIMIAGESAGGYFITYIANMSLDHTLFDKLGIDFKNKDKFKIKAMVNNCGVYSLNSVIDCGFPGMKFMLNSFTGYSHKEIRANLADDKIKILSPTVCKDFPPTMIIYGCKDKLQNESILLAQDYEKVNSAYILYKGEGLLSMHAWGLATFTKRGKECMTATIDFISQYL